MAKFYNVGAVTGTLTAAPVAGVFTAGPSLFLTPNIRFLSALCTLLAETNTITMEAQWQVSNDGSTWVNIQQPNNAAMVVFGTGTAGADVAVTRVVSAPDTVYGWRYARIGVVNRVATGAAGDTYAFGLIYSTVDL